MYSCHEKFPRWFPRYSNVKKFHVSGNFYVTNRWACAPQIDFVSNVSPICFCDCQNVTFGQKIVLECCAGGTTVIVKGRHVSFSPTLDPECPVASSLSPDVQKGPCIKSITLGKTFLMLFCVVASVLRRRDVPGRRDDVSACVTFCFCLACSF